MEPPEDEKKTRERQGPHLDPWHRTEPLGEEGGVGGVVGFDVEDEHCEEAEQDPLQQDDVVQEAGGQGALGRGGRDGVGDCGGGGAEGA